MILSDLIGARVDDATGQRVGWVIDARFTAAPDMTMTMTLRGFIVSPHSGSSFLGYERTETRAPWLLWRALWWRHRGSFLVLWPDIAQIDRRRVHLCPGYVRHSPAFTARDGRPD